MDPLSLRLYHMFYVMTKRLDSEYPKGMKMECNPVQLSMEGLAKPQILLWSRLGSQNIENKSKCPSVDAPPTSCTVGPFAKKSF